MSDSASYSPAAVERVCSRTDIGMISTPLLWCDARVGLGGGAQARLPQVRRRRRGDRNVLTKQSAGFGRGFGCRAVIVGDYPVASVLPGRARQHRVRLGRMRRLRGLDDECAIQVGAEAHRVVAVARQRADAVMATGLQRVGDGVGEEGMWADFDEGAVVVRRLLLMAWVNRTGWRTLATQ